MKHNKRTHLKFGDYIKAVLISHFSSKIVALFLAPLVFAQPRQPIITSPATSDIYIKSYLAYCNTFSSYYVDAGYCLTEMKKYNCASSLDIPHEFCYKLVYSRLNSIYMRQDVLDGCIEALRQGCNKASK